MPADADAPRVGKSASYRLTGPGRLPGHQRRGVASMSALRCSTRLSALAAGLPLGEVLEPAAPPTKRKPSPGHLKAFNRAMVAAGLAGELAHHAHGGGRQGIQVRTANGASSAAGGAAGQARGTRLRLLPGEQAHTESASNSG